MKRRTFIIALVSVGAATAVPIINHHRKHVLARDPLMRPNVLANFCDGGTIRDIGTLYRSEVPEENEENKLRELLLANEPGNTADTTDEKVICDMLDKKISDEFKNGKIVIEDGWVLSETEARQCALFSLSDP